MTRHAFTIEGRLPGLNEIIGKARSNHFASAGQKRKWTGHCAKAATDAGLPRIEKPVNVYVEWYEQNKRRDPDNVACGLKFALDGLVVAGVLVDDGQAEIREIRHVVITDKQNPRVVVTLEETV